MLTSACHAQHPPLCLPLMTVPTPPTLPPSGELLDPLLPLLVRALRSRHAPSVTTALQALTQLMQSQLPGLQKTAAGGRGWRGRQGHSIPLHYCSALPCSSRVNLSCPQPLPPTAPCRRGQGGDRAAQALPQDLAPHRPGLLPPAGRHAAPVRALAAAPGPAALPGHLGVCRPGGGRGAPERLPPAQSAALLGWGLLCLPTDTPGGAVLRRVPTLPGGMPLTCPTPVANHPPTFSPPPQAILSRKLVLPEVYDLMNRVQVCYGWWGGWVWVQRGHGGSPAGCWCSHTTPCPPTPAGVDGAVTGRARARRLLLRPAAVPARLPSGCAGGRDLVGRHAVVLRRAWHLPAVQPLTPPCPPLALAHCRREAAAGAPAVPADQPGVRARERVSTPHPTANARAAWQAALWEHCTACPRLSLCPPPSCPLRRQAALDMLGVVLAKFPEQLVAQWAEMVRVGWAV